MAIRNGFDNEFNTCYVTFPRKCSTTIVDYLRALTSDCADPKITIALDLLHIRKRNRQFNHSFFDSRGSTLGLLLSRTVIQLSEAPPIGISTVAPPTVSNKDSTDDLAYQEFKETEVSSRPIHHIE
ncbi:hypothetical protein GCK72_010621 [Caenorhabditis remanei]|uniref:Uncharacterized protein n=1 Tax=Caenorhabditis remanei TaxID=31234 RepID=A0A6A5H5P2_CAERE|nr:hypothetical protein GCK72_010621 [Caenorhabditis remanei]KAF1762359.1 hypothetical protein GCK72_010621 [Caenorhabditis remanei]